MFRIVESGCPPPGRFAMNCKDTGMGGVFMVFARQEVLTMKPVHKTIASAVECENTHGAELDAIRAALVDGETSGEARPFDVTAFKLAMRAVHDRMDVLRHL